MIAKVLRILNSALLVTGLTLSPVANALQVRLNESMRLRELNGDQLDQIGTLAAGSIVEIPDRYKVVKHGKVDSRATLDKWLHDSGWTRPEINKRVSNPRQDFFYPVRIVKMAPGSEGGRALIGQTHYMALRVLQRSAKGMTVRTKSPVYRFDGDDVPLKSAEAPAPETTTEAAGACPECSTPDPMSDVAPQSEPLTDVGSAVSDAADEAFVDESRNNDFQKLPSGRRGVGFSPSCSNFIHADGSYGPYGTAVLNEVSQYEIFNQPGHGIRSMCRNYDSFSPEQRRHFWVWLFASVSEQEAGCNKNIAASPEINPNGVAVGLYQIEERASLRAGRDRQYGGQFCSGDPYSVKVNTRCAVRMMVDVLDNDRGPYSTENQYWSSLLNRHTIAKHLIGRYTACGNGGRRR